MIFVTDADNLKMWKRDGKKTAKLSSKNEEEEGKKDPPTSNKLDLFRLKSFMELLNEVHHFPP